MIYVFVWESLLGRFLPGVRAISSREQALLIYDGIWHDDFDQASRAAVTMAGRGGDLPAGRCLAFAPAAAQLSSPMPPKRCENTIAFRVMCRDNRGVWHDGPDESLTPLTGWGSTA